MENASKALIIAGAILLSILIIGLGMLIFTQAQEAMQGAGLSSEQITTYNSRFISYEGTQAGSSVRTLCDVVRNHNNSKIDDTSEQVGMVLTNAAGATGNVSAPKDDNSIDDAIDAAVITNIKASIKSGRRYKVSFAYAKSGKVMCINIEPEKTN